MSKSLRSIFDKYGEDAKKLTDADYEKMQKEFVKTKKYQQLEEYVTIQ